MAPAIGRPALDNGSCGSIPGDGVALPPQNIHLFFVTVQLPESFKFSVDIFEYSVSKQK